MTPSLWRILCLLIMIVKIANLVDGILRLKVCMTIFMWKVIMWSDGKIDMDWASGTLFGIHMGQNSRLIIFPYHNSIVTWIMGILWFSFSRFLLIDFKVLKLLNTTNLDAMGGDRNRVEPFS